MEQLYRGKTQFLDLWCYVGGLEKVTPQVMIPFDAKTIFLRRILGQPILMEISGDNFNDSF